jgi:hypothetical protein
MKNQLAWNRQSGKIVETYQRKCCKGVQTRSPIQLTTQEKEHRILPRQDSGVNDIKHQRLDHRIRSGTM